MDISLKHKFFKICLYILLASSVFGEFLVQKYFPHKHYFSLQGIPFFNALYGFIGCILIVLCSKALGHYWLQKRDDYYDNKKQIVEGINV